MGKGASPGLGTLGVLGHAVPLSEVDRKHTEVLMDKHQNVSEVARILGIDRRTFAAKTTDLATRRRLGLRICLGTCTNGDLVQSRISQLIQNANNFTVGDVFVRLQDDQGRAPFVLQGLKPFQGLRLAELFTVQE